MSSELWEFVKAALTLLGALAAGVISSWLLRISQKESSQITLLTNLVDQIQEERDKHERDAKQIPMWRRYAQRLRSQIYGLGGQPVEPDKDLEL